MGAAQSAIESVHATEQHSLGRSLVGCFSRLPVSVLHLSAASVPHIRCASLLCFHFLSRPCVRCLKPFTPSADDLREAAGYQPVATQPNQSHNAPLPHTAAHASNTAAAADSADDNTDWEEFEDFDQEQDRIEKGRTTTTLGHHNHSTAADLSNNTTAAAASASTSRSTSPPISIQSSTSASPLSTTPTHNHNSSHIHIPPPDHSRPRPSPSPPIPSRSSPPAAIDFFGSVGLTSSGYQEPVRLQSKTKPQSQSSSLPYSSPVLTAAQRAEVLSEYGLDEVGVEVASWEDGLELDVGSGGGASGGLEEGARGKKGKNGDKKKKKGLGAVVMDDV